MGISERGTYIRRIWYSTDRVFFQKSSPAGGEWIRVERIKFWNPTASSPVPVESPRSRDESRLKFF